MKWIGYSLSGTPVKPGTYGFKLRAEIEDTVPLIYIDMPYTITVLDSSSKPLTIDNNVLPAAKVTNLYSAQIKVSGGKGKKAFMLIYNKSSAELPSGFAVSDPGIVSCAPQAIDSGLYKLYAEAGKSFEFKLSASGGFTNQFKYR